MKLADTVEAPQFRAVVEIANHLIDSTATKVKAIEKDISTERTLLNAAIGNWNDHVAEHQKLRDKILEKVGAQKIAAKQATELQAVLTAETAKLQELHRQIAAIGDSTIGYRKARDDFKDLVAQQIEKLKEWGARIEEISDNTIAVELEETGDLSEVHEALAIMAARTRSQEAVRVRKFSEASAGGGPWKVLDSVISEINQLLKWKLSGADQERRPKTDTISELLGEAETVGKAFAEQVDQNRLVPVAQAAPRAKITLTYKAEAREISFDKASEGQRAAALLMMLLKQGGGPLIIDQPEGDLDNNVVTKVVELIHQVKHQRQIIVATHNANLVVNGASEFVVVMTNDETGKRIVEGCGAIDSPEINKSISQTMEGGKDAFRDRQRKYGF